MKLKVKPLRELLYFIKNRHPLKKNYNLVLMLKRNVQVLDNILHKNIVQADNLNSVNLIIWIVKMLSQKMKLDLEIMIWEKLIKDLFIHLDKNLKRVRNILTKDLLMKLQEILDLYPIIKINISKSNRPNYALIFDFLFTTLL